jgi:heavy metal translocating P-type ATPase
MRMPILLMQPYREYALSVLLVSTLLYYYVFDGTIVPVLAAATLGSIAPLKEALDAVRTRTITIGAFNFFALAVSYATGEYTSAAFIALMLTIASWLDWRTDARASNAIEELLKLKPTRAVRIEEHAEVGIESSAIQTGDLLLVKTGERIPADGIIEYGTGFINEASLTGESVPVSKTVGDEVFTSTLSESGILKIRATRVGTDSTLERMAALIAEAGQNKSKEERLADRFAGIFLPIVFIAGIATYLVTGDVRKMAALFLIVCADDIAVSIPLAITASLGHAAKRGVIIKGGQWLRALANVRTLAFDKTGTLTHGTFTLASATIEHGFNEQLFWSLVGSAEKYSEHPVGKALYREAVVHTPTVPDPTNVQVVKAAGISASIADHTVTIGNLRMLTDLATPIPTEMKDAFIRGELSAQTVMYVVIDGTVRGVLGIADTPRPEAREALRSLERAHITPVMLTGDNETVARAIATDLGITSFRAQMTPESKMRVIEELGRAGKLAMVGDGVNDAPALARADVGIAMGEGGTAVAVEAANIIILTDRLDRIPEMITLARKTVSVVNLNMGIWLVTNVVGVGLVFAGIATPAFAALYNLLSDFLPLINSARLFSRVPHDGGVVNTR